MSKLILCDYFPNFYKAAKRWKQLNITLKMKKIILLFVIILNLSCSNDKTEVEDRVPYFPFLQVDSDKFINSTEVGKILIYKNQNNAELKFKVLKNKTEKQLESRATFVVGTYKYFYYDEQSIHFGNINVNPNEYYDENYKFKISVKRWPKIYQTNPTIISSESILIANIGLYPFDNSATAFLNYSEPLVNLTINSQIFTNVRKIILPINQYPNPNATLKGISILYFDQNRGVIGFDDIQNNEWRLQN